MHICLEIKSLQQLASWLSWWFPHSTRLFRFLQWLSSTFRPVAIKRSRPSAKSSSRARWFEALPPHKLQLPPFGWCFFLLSMDFLFFWGIFRLMLNHQQSIVTINPSPEFLGSRLPVLQAAQCLYPRGIDGCPIHHDGSSIHVWGGSGVTSGREPEVKPISCFATGIFPLILAHRHLNVLPKTNCEGCSSFLPKPRNLNKPLDHSQFLL